MPVNVARVCAFASALVVLAHAAGGVVQAQTLQASEIDTSHAPIYWS